MWVLILGVALWWGAHLFKRVAPAARARLGDRGRGLVALLLLGSVVLMVMGYRGAAVLPVYTPLPGAGHANNLLMLVSIYLFGVGNAKGLLGQKLRHPMLTGMMVWAIAHLLVNGDLASLVLFGGLGAWAVVSMLLINAREPAWSPPANAALKGDLINLAVTVILYAVIAFIHGWLGYDTFLGSYS